VVVDQSTINNTYLMHTLRGTWSYSGLDQLRGLVTIELRWQIPHGPRRVIAQIGFGKRFSTLGYLADMQDCHPAIILDASYPRPGTLPMLIGFGNFPLSPKGPSSITGNGMGINPIQL